MSKWLDDLYVYSHMHDVPLSLHAFICSVYSIEVTNYQTFGAKPILWQSRHQKDATVPKLWSNCNLCKLRTDRSLVMIGEIKVITYTTDTALLY